ncbi:unnamed protein product [Trichogramma brassicae]|uniref:PPM-type phosphatase domain-containing protein n=1 Tax=Trichogramma brassicae TaxID=86971 RepID=A0A6H5IAB8_9HYME|nr:unnamed protein product [Trichogramma brassicae]
MFFFPNTDCPVDYAKIIEFEQRFHFRIHGLDVKLHYDDHDPADTTVTAGNKTQISIPTANVAFTVKLNYNFVNFSGLDTLKRVGDLKLKHDKQRFSFGIAFTVKEAKIQYQKYKETTTMTTTTTTITFARVPLAIATATVLLLLNLSTPLSAEWIDCISPSDATWIVQSGDAGRDQQQLAVRDADVKIAYERDQLAVYEYVGHDLVNVLLNDTLVYFQAVYEIVKKLRKENMEQINIPDLQQNFTTGSSWWTTTGDFIAQRGTFEFFYTYRGSINFHTFSNTDRLMSIPGELLLNEDKDATIKGREMVIGAIELAYKQMDQIVEHQAHRGGGGCTALTVLFLNGRLYAAGAGDSRLTMGAQELVQGARGRSFGREWWLKKAQDNGDEEVKMASVDDISVMVVPLYPYLCEHRQWVKTQQQERRHSVSSTQSSPEKHSNELHRMTQKYKSVATCTDRIHSLSSQSRLTTPRRAANAMKGINQCPDHESWFTLVQRDALFAPKF